MNTLLNVLQRERLAPFKSSCYYCPEADALNLHFRADEYYAERVDDRLTVYLSLDSDQLVGCQVKGIRHTLHRFEGFGIGVSGQDVDVVAVFFAHGMLAKVTERKRYAELALEAAKHRLHVPQNRMLVPA